ncbi:hypothetical protein PM8797T_31368 [Gimesia maris DSM 8797]|nr:hypothetical protein PM8797T_31368 [Gimesia maris DSM 8797]
MFADGTGATFFLGHRIVAVSAAGIPPAIKGNISRSRVVSLQDLLDQKKEIPQTALCQRLIEGDFAFSFAERVSLDVGMMYVVRAGFRQGNDPIGLGITELTPAEPDFKFTQVDFPQDDGWSPDDDFPFGPVDAGFLEFIWQGTEFGDQIPQRRDHRRSLDGGELAVTGR